MKSNIRTHKLVKIITLFVLLTVIGIGMTTGAMRLGDELARAVLMNIGSAIFGGALAFYLIEMFRWDEGR